MPPSRAIAHCMAEREMLLLPDKDDSAAHKGEYARDAVFSSLVERYGRLMFRVAYSLLRNAEDAEDAVQEAFLKLYRGEAWRRMEDEKAYLARTVWRVALDRLPKLKQQPIDDYAEHIISAADSPEITACRSAQASRLRRMIDALPEDLRRVLVLSAIDELNSREIASLVGVPEGTVRTRLMTARNELRRRYQASTRETSKGEKR